METSRSWGRITINGERTQFSTRLSVAPEHWDVGMGRVAGRSNAAGRINEQLSNIHYHIERCYNKLFYEQSFVTPMMVKEMYFGANLRQETVLALFQAAQRRIQPYGRHQPQQGHIL